MRDYNSTPEIRELASDMLTLFGPNGENWCQGYDAYDAEGFGVDGDDPRACSWCMLGGMYKLRPDLPATDNIKFSKLVAYHSGYANSGTVDFNDSHHWPEVKAVLEKIANEQPA